MTTLSLKLFDEANGSTAFTDEVAGSTANWSIVGTDPLEVRTAEFKSGTGSLYAGPNAVYQLNFAAGELFNDFTFECWVKPDPLEATNTSTKSVMGIDGVGGNQYVSISYNFTSFQLEIYSPLFGNRVLYTFSEANSSSEFSINDWIHIAVVRQTGTPKILVNNFLVYNVEQLSGNIDIRWFTFGGMTSLNGSTPGAFYIDNIRFANEQLYQNFIYKDVFLPPTVNDVPKVLNILYNMDYKIDSITDAWTHPTTNYTDMTQNLLGPLGIWAEIGTGGGTGPALPMQYWG